VHGEPAELVAAPEEESGVDETLEGVIDGRVVFLVSHGSIL